MRDVRTRRSKFTTAPSVTARSKRGRDAIALACAVERLEQRMLLSSTSNILPQSHAIPGTAAIMLAAPNASQATLTPRDATGSSFYVGERVEAAQGGTNVRDATLASILYTQVGGVHGTIVSGPVYGTAGGFTGNWWNITWDSGAPSFAGQSAYSAESVISPVGAEGDVPQPNLLNVYYASSENIYWQSGNAPSSTNPPNPQLGSALGNCTWYAYGRMLELGYDPSQLSVLQHDAGQWPAEATAAGIPVDTLPAVGSIAEKDSSTGFSLGHVAVVEAVNSDGTVTVSESSYDTNPNSPWDFEWRNRTVSPTWFDHYIHIAPAGTGPLSGVKITGAQLSNAVLSPGDSTSITFQIDSPASQNVLLGASLEATTSNGTIQTIPLGAPSAAVSLVGGLQTVSRTYTVPANIVCYNNYRLLAALWQDSNTDGQIDSGDMELTSSTATYSVSVAYSPDAIRRVYGIDQLRLDGSPATGAGQTIAIIDAYNNPNIKCDLAAFDSEFGLPAPPSFQVVDEFGNSIDPASPTVAVPAPPDCKRAQFELETDLDVEWAHAIAPGANILLIEINSLSVTDTEAGVAVAGDPKFAANVVSMSFITGDVIPDSVFGGYKSVTFIAGSGDDGKYIGEPGDKNPPLGPAYPAGCSNVLSIGGTSLAANADGSWGMEATWTSPSWTAPPKGVILSGYGTNTLDPVPKYQQAFAGSAGRVYPDAAFDGDPNTGVQIFDGGAGGNPWFANAGTSFGAPAWAGLVALADQALASYSAPSLGSLDTLNGLYSRAGTADFHEIGGVPFETAVGLGTPVANCLLPDLTTSIDPPTPSTSSVVGGNTLFINFTVKSGFDTNLLLGASLHDPATGQTYDLGYAGGPGVALRSGTNSFTRYLTVPAGTPNGTYDLITKLWRDANGNGQIDAGDQLVSAGTTPAALSVVGAAPVTDTWTGAASNDWNNPANWSAGAVPGVNDVAAINSGTVNIANEATAKSINVYGGVVNWAGGDLVPGSMTLSPGAVLNISVSNSGWAGTLNNAGTINWLGGNLEAGGTPSFHSPLVVNNLAGGVFDIQGDSQVSWAQSSAPVFNNAGLLRKSAGTGSSTFANFSAFNNTGSVQANSGNLVINGTPYAQSGGETILKGGNLWASSISLKGGELSGIGAVDGSVTNTGGIVHPGGPTGVLTINGNYVQSGSGQLQIEMDGNPLSGLYGPLDVNGTMSLGGSLAVVLGYTPTRGDLFPVLNDDGTDAIGGTFAGLPQNSVVSVGGSYFHVNYQGGDGNDLTLTAILPPPTVSAAGTPAIFAGDTYTLNLGYSDPNADPAQSFSVNWGDGSAVQTVTGSPSSVTHTFANASGANPFVIHASANNSDGTFPASPVQVMVYAAPTLTNGTLAVTGTAGNDTVSFSTAGSSLNLALGAASRQYSLSSISSITYTDAGGNDSITDGASTPLKLNLTTGNDSVTANGGPVTLLPGTGAIALSVNSGTVTMPASTGTGIRPVNFSNLSIGAGAKLTVASSAAHANRSVVVVPSSSFAIDAAGLLDLNDNDLILQNAGTAGLSSVQSQISAGSNSQTWNGTHGLTSSSAKSAGNTALGFALNDGSQIAKFTTFDGVAVGSSDVIVKYTYQGDADLNGVVNGDDYFYIDSNYPMSGGSTWVTGDFDYNGVTNGDDYFYIDNNYLAGTGGANGPQL